MKKENQMTSPEHPAGAAVLETSPGRRFRAILAGLACLWVMWEGAFAQPVIVTQPQNQTVSVFASAIFRVTATGQDPLTYQWRFNEAELASMTNSSLTLTNVKRAAAGNYNVRVTDTSGSVTSRVANLTIVPFNAPYFLGDSLTDTHNCSGSWPPAQYYNGRACNGPMWPEFISTNLGVTYISANNFAVCGAMSSDVQNQAYSVPSLTRSIPRLCFLWGGDNDFDHALPPDGLGFGYSDVMNDTLWNTLLHTSVLNKSNAITVLYQHGIREIVVRNVMDVSRFPESIGAFGTDTNRLARFSQRCAQYNVELKAMLDAYAASKPDLRLLEDDFYSQFNDVLDRPENYGFTKTTIDVLDDATLTDKSFGGPGADYVFWNGFHITSKFQELAAATNFALVSNARLETLQFSLAGNSAQVAMNHLRLGRDYTLQTSTNLQEWQTAQSFTASAGTNQWSGPLAENTTAYYRLTWQP